ncbi:MAG: hypothetical protein QXO93_05040 [Acidilobaceae archaeon]
MKILQIDKKDNRWRNVVEISREEATVISTALGKDICSSEARYASLPLSFLLDNLVVGLLANSRRESSGCIIILEAYDNTISMLTGRPEAERDDVEYLVRRVFSIINALYSQLEVVKTRESLCFKAEDISYLNKLLEKADLLCITWYTGDFKGLEFTIASKSIEPIARIQVETSIPPLIAGKRVHMWNPRLWECIEIEKDAIIVGGTLLKPAQSVECIMLDVKLKDIDREVVDRVKTTFNELKNNQSYAMLIETLNHPHIIDTTDVELRKTQNTIIATITPRTNPGERIKITIYTKVNQ